MSMTIDSNHAVPNQHRHPEPFSPAYDGSFTESQMQMVAGTVHPQHPHATDAENIWRGFETTENEQLPVWISDSTLGGNSFTQNGMDAFLLPINYLPAQQIW